MSIKIQKASLVGSIISGVLASICCLGPIVFAVLGIGGAGFILKFEQFRPVFIVVAVLFLATAFYYTYKKKSAAHCEPGTLCANPKSDTMNKVVLWIATVFVAFFIFFPGIISRFV